MTTKPVALLSFIRGAETSRGYEDYYRGSVLAPPRPLTQMTLDEVRAWQNESVRAGSKSSAAGGYQFIRGTLADAQTALGLPGSTVFSPETQDALATVLLKRRGYDKWAAGQLSDEAFMGNLTREWASLPTPSGRSAYHGDGLNAATVDNNAFLAAINATRNGEEIDLSGLTPGDQRYVPTGGSSDAAARMSLADPNTTPGGVPLGDEAGNQPAHFITDRERAQAEQEAALNAPSWAETWNAAVDNEQISSNVARMFGASGFVPDDTFEYSDDLWKELTEGLPDDYLEGFGEAVSEDHARVLAERIRADYERDSTIAQAGWTGIGASLGAAILDPVAIGISLATEGAAAPVIYGAKVGRVGRVIRAGLLASTVNAGTSAFITSQDANGRAESIAYAAAAGFLFGGAAGGLSRMPMDAELQKAARSFMRHTETKLANPVAGAADDSVGAARVPGTGDVSDAQYLAQLYGSAPVAARPGFLPRLDMVGRGMLSKSGIARHWFSRMSEDAVGQIGEKGAVTAADTVEEVSRRLIQQVNVRVSKVHNKAFSAWASERGIGRLKIASDPAIKAEYNRLVTSAIRRPDEPISDANVAASVGAMRKELAYLLKYGKEHGIRGFADIPEDAAYIKRGWLPQAIEDLEGRYGFQAPRAVLQDAIMQGQWKWRNANPAAAARVAAMTPEEAGEIAKALIKSVKSRKHSNLAFNQALVGGDKDLLREMLDDAGVGEKEADSIIRKLSPGENGDAGRIGEARFRLNLDETYESSIAFQAIDGSGARKIKLEDMLDNDAEALFEDYTRSVISAGQWERVMADFKVPNADGMMPTYAPSLASIKKAIAEGTPMTKDEGDALFDLMDTLYSAVMGHATEAPKAWHKYTRLARMFNFIRVMGSSGWAQMAELGNIVGHGGMTGFIDHMPALRKMIGNVTAGHPMNGDLMDDLLEAWNPGADLALGTSHMRLDDGGYSAISRDFKSTGMQRVEETLKSGRHATAIISGLSHATAGLQRWGTRVAVQRFVTMAHGGRKINLGRLKALGVDDAMAKRINQQLQQATVTSGGITSKHVVRRLDWAKFTDPEAKDAFINAVHRWSRQTVQDNNVGNLPGLFTKETGKVIFQFRTFMVSAYTKQLMSGMARRDWDTAAALLTSVFFGGLFYTAQTYLNSFGQPNRKEWLEERLSTKSIGLAAIQRTGMSTFIPLIVDTATTSLGEDPIFSFRTTELGSSVFGNPTVDGVNKSLLALGGLLSATFSSQHDYSQQDWNNLKQLLPWQNAMVVRNVLAAVGSGLPRYSQ
jgi:hypothetical protein